MTTSIKSNHTQISHSFKTWPSLALLLICGTVVAQPLTVTATSQGANLVITGACVPGQGKPILEFIPIQLTNPTYTGPKKYQTTWVAQKKGGIFYFSDQVSAQAVTTGVNQGCSQSGAGGGFYQMKKSDWAHGQWKIKLWQGTNHSSAVVVNI